MAISDQQGTGARANAEQAAVWDGPAGEHRVRHADQDASEVRLHNQRLRAATGVGPGDHVLDIGCGTGQSTRDAARAAVPGTALGVDLSARMLERARQLSDEEGLHNVTYEQADAQVHRFPSEHFDLGISRFGTMFFADPVTAFTNIGRALRPEAPLVLMVWQGRDRNELASAIRQSLAAGRALPAETPGTPHPFSLADPATVEGILHAAGFAAVSFTDVHEPVYYGRDSAAAYDFVRGLRTTNDLLAGLDAATTARALERLRATLAAHDSGRGVLFDSRAWIVTARRR